MIIVIDNDYNKNYDDFRREVYLMYIADQFSDHKSEPFCVNSVESPWNLASPMKCCIILYLIMTGSQLYQWCFYHMCFVHLSLSLSLTHTHAHTHIAVSSSNNVNYHGSNVLFISSIILIKIPQEMDGMKSVLKIKYH